jgi:hypothetical protein
LDGALKAREIAARNTAEDIGGLQSGYERIAREIERYSILKSRDVACTDIELAEAVK